MSGYFIMFHINKQATQVNELPVIIEKELNWLRFVNDLLLLN